MNTRAARREYFEAVAEFQRSLQEFSAGMGHLLDDPSEPNGAPHVQPSTMLLKLLGPRKPPKTSVACPAADRRRKEDVSALSLA